MLDKSNFSIEVAVANCSGAMEADTISKNGRSSKSQMSRKNLMNKALLFCIGLCASISLWGQTYSFEGTNNLSFDEDVKIDLNNMILRSCEYIADEPVETGFSIENYKKYTEGNSIVIWFSIKEIYNEFDYCKVTSNKITFGKTKSTKIETVIKINGKNDFDALLKAIESKNSSSSTNTTSTRYSELKGTTWTMIDLSLLDPEPQQDCQFIGNGVLITLKDSMRNNSWTQNDNSVIIKINDNFTTLELNFIDANLMRGTASNRNGGRWSVELRKK